MNKTLTVLTAAAALGLAACEVEQTEEGEMPQVDVEGGQLPEYDVDPAEVEFGTEERTITVPDVDVNPPEGEEGPPDRREPPREEPPGDR